MLKGLLLSILGSVLTFFVVGILQGLFGLFIMFGFGVTELKSVKKYIKKLFKKKKHAV
jgi:hypothetical protein